MQKILWIAVFLFVLPMAVLAEDAPKAEFFGGYSYVHADGGFNLSGWNLSVAGNVNKWFGVVADFSGRYNDGKVHLFQFSPKFSYRENERVTPFVDTLFGGAHSGSDTAFTWTLGGWRRCESSRSRRRPRYPSRLRHDSVR